MKNNTNYFSHDCNAREDEKILQLRAKYGREGYGIRWLMVEKLSEATDYKLLISNKVVISTLYGANKDVISYLFTLGLLIEDGDYFYSPSFLRRMSLKTAAIEKMSEGGKKAMETRRGKHKVLKKKLSDGASEADGYKVLITSKVKQSKVKEIKENNIINNIDEKNSTVPVEASQEKIDKSNPEINKILEIIKSYNNGVIDGTGKELRIWGNNLLNKLKKVKSVEDGKYTWDSILIMILEIISKNDYYSAKIAGPKKLYNSLAELMNVCSQEVRKQNKGEVKRF